MDEVRSEEVHDKMVDEPVPTQSGADGSQQAETVDSTSDDRVVNNLMRHQYKVLTNIEKEQMQHIKDRGLGFVRYLHTVGKTPEILGDRPAGQASRELAVAQTKIEEAVFWAVKHVTG